MARLATCLLLLSVLAWAGDPEDLARAKERLRALEADIFKTIARASPSVGAVVNHAALLDVKTGRVIVRPRSLGSGVVITRDGFLLTNVHVVEGAGYLTVTLPGGLRCTAVLHADTSEGKVKGDIALLKLKHPEGKKFPFSDWRAGKPNLLRPGSFVFAMGNPHGHALDGTPVITMGVLSGKGRAASDTGYLYVDSLQTDAEINPGNSGGPLFDVRGRLIGINGLLRSTTGRSHSGVGFAIPIDQIRLFLRRLIKDEGGGVGYGFHGLLVVSNGGESGARVARIERGSPAAKVGMAPGDVVVRVNRKKVANRSDFMNLVGKLPEGKYINVAYRRKKRSKSARFKLIAYADYLESVGRTSRRKGPLPANERGYLGFQYTVGRGGWTVKKVMAKTGAQKLGLKVGDLVTEIDGAPPGDVKELWKRLAVRAADEVVFVRYKRTGVGEKRGKLVLCGAAEAAGLGE